MKNAKTASKKNSFSKLFKTILSLVMVLSLLVGCSLMFVGCTQSSDDQGADNSGNNSGNNSGDKGESSKYEGLKEEEYLQKLVSDNLGTAIDSLGEVYDALLESMGDSSAADLSSGYKLDLTLSVGNDLLDMLEQAIFGGDIGDMSFLSKISLSMDVGIKDQLEKLQLGLGMNGQNIMTLNLLMGLSDYVMYLAVPELNDAYIKFDMGKMMGDDYVTGMATTAAQMSALAEALPDAEKLTVVLNRYLNLALAELDNVEQSTAKLEINGLKQECTQLTLKIYEADALALCKSVLNAAKDDADLKKIIEDVVAAAEELTGEKIGADQAYADFKEGIDDLLAEMNEVDETDTENPIELITYVDKDHNIIGHKLSVFSQGEAETVFYYYTVTEGDNFAFEAAIPGDADDSDDMKVSGTGTIKDGKTNGSFTISAEGTDYVTLKVEDLTEESGTFTLTPTADGEKELELDELPFKKLALQIKLIDDGIELNVLSESKLLAGIALKASESNGPDLSVPSDAADATDSSALQKWAEKLVLDKIEDNLKKAGVPQNLIDALKGGLTGGSQSDPEMAA